ncbi:MAG TPA: hypothetical protein VLA13_10425 [Massilibacterium sp.]|nr:hypothetical protein [Massilibacterium sp.]
MYFEKRLKLLRDKVRKKSPYIVEQLIRKNGDKDLCIFCGSREDLTKEHVIPKWIFESQPDKHFITNINGLSQKYIKTVVPACSECNSYLLGLLEEQIKSSFKKVNLQTAFFSAREQDNIISWLEIIDYKFQALNLRREFLKHKEAEYIRFLSDIPLAFMEDKASISPNEVREKIINSSNRIICRSKKIKRNSLLVFKTKNPDFHFFHEMDDFIFIELPRFDVAAFLFLEKQFNQHKQAHNEAMRIIKEVY